MKTKMKTLILLPFFALLLFTSCQDEVTDITPPNQNEALVANSNLTAMVSATAKMDGSKDNIIDRANCLSVKFPVTVIVNNREEIEIYNYEDLRHIEIIFDEFEDDQDFVEIIFPIVVITDNHDEIVINSKAELEEMISKCRGENEEDDDIECIDFKYPISFTVYNPNFQIIDVITVESDRELHRFMKRVIEADVLASLNFPVTMLLYDGTEETVNSNQELERAIEAAKDACDEDDDNDYGDDDFTKERLDNLLKTCPWVVYEFERNEENLVDVYREYVMVFKEDNVVKVRKRNGDIITGTWTTRVTDHGAMIKLEFDVLTDFVLEWFVYDLDSGRIKLYQSGGNRIILKKNCDISIDVTKERIQNYLQECFWRVARLHIDGSDNEKDYIGTPLKFFANNVVKIRVNGEFVEGTYDVLAFNSGFVLQINLEGRPNLQLEWLITFLEPGLIKLTSLGNIGSQMILERHCPNIDGDLNYIDDILMSNTWRITQYIDNDIDKTEDFSNWAFGFNENGKAFAEGDGRNVNGSWLSYRNNGLFLGLKYEDEQLLNILNHRWKIGDVTSVKIELKDFNANGEIERILVFEKW